jgi:hypothetical protein
VTYINDSEFEEPPEREPAWLRLDRATVYRKKLLAAGYLPIPVNGKAPAIQGWSDIQATDALIGGQISMRAQSIPEPSPPTRQLSISMSSIPPSPMSCIAWWRK